MFSVPDEHVPHLTIPTPFQVSLPSDNLEPTFPRGWCGLSCEQEDPNVKGFQVLPGRTWCPKQNFLKMLNRVAKFPWNWWERETSLNSLFLWKCREELLSVKALFTRTVINSLGSLPLGSWLFSLPLFGCGNWDLEKFLILCRVLRKVSEWTSLCAAFPFR